ncbi:MAG: AAA family ATPase [Gammaproteobacteria bacterium]|nr:AAA family ATPase [Gammaproteobacteria bacterium]
MTDVREWLGSLGLGQYADAFEENSLDWDLLASLTSEELKEIGVRPLGHRKRILEAAASLAPPAATSESPAPAGDAERRQLTVMFCDLAGSVELGERMDVEHYRDLLSRLRNAMVGAVERNGGFVARHQGDGVLAYFGYPQAHENDPECAVRAGLDVVRAVTALEHPYDVEAMVRVGIATGPVVVGDVLSTGASERAELAALGRTPNLAARLQAEAEPNSVVVSDTTRTLTAGLFDVEALPARAVKGISSQIVPYRVHTEVRGQSRFAARTGTGLSPFVGREEELDILARRWSRVEEGRGQVVVIVGEAGIGKSRLFEHFRELIAPGSHEAIRVQCSPYHESSALYPTIAAFERILGFHEISDDATRLDALREHLLSVGHGDDEVLGLLAHMLSLSTGGRFPAIDALEPQRRRQRILAALVEYAQKLAALRPLVCAFEDVHWADPSTLELLGRLVESVEHARVMIVVTSRPGLEASWMDMANVRVLSLSRLAPEESERLLRGVATALAALSAETVEQILSRAGGNPLFIEELARAVAQSSGETHIPDTLQDLLMARLDASEGGRAVVQCAAVIGRSFERSVLEHAWDGTPARLSAGLDALERLGVLTRKGEHETARYTFRHALLRDAAYASLLRDRRASLHARAAAAIRSRTPAVAATQPELLAFHYGEAGLMEQAVEHWLSAGRRAAEASADREAVTHLETGLRALTEVSDAGVAAELELKLRLQLGSVLSNTIGTAAPETRQVYERARELAERAGTTEEKFAALWGLWHHHHMRGELEAERRAADDVLEFAAGLTDSDLVLQAHHVVWGVQHVLGTLALALEHAEAGVSLYDLDRHRRHAFIYAGHDPGVCAGTASAMIKWALGFPDTASRRAEWTLALAKTVAHPMSLAQAYWCGAMVAGQRGDYRQTIELAEELGRHASEHELSVWIANSAIVRGWALAVGEHELGALEALAAAVADRRARGARMRMPLDLAMLAEAYVSCGRAGAASDVIQEALKIAASTGEQRWDSYVLSVRAEILALDPTQLEESEAMFRSAIDVARRQGARSGELRAATGLARLMVERNDLPGARDLLAPVLGWFTEGLETRDVRSAGELMAQIQ